MSPKTPPAPETKATRTRRRILAAAAHEFAERGYAGTSLRQVAAGAGLQLGSLYFHFESKDDLIAEVLRDGIDHALAQVEAAIDALGPGTAAPDRLRAAIDAHLHALHETGDRAAAVVRTVDAFPAPLQRQHATEPSLRSSTSESSATCCSPR
jgi:AcrR family transcriptional regulator